MMQNTIGRLAVLILLIIFINMSPILGVLFGILIVLSSNYKKHESFQNNSDGEKVTGKEDADSIEQGEESTVEQEGEDEGDEEEEDETADDQQDDSVSDKVNEIGEDLIKSTNGAEVGPEKVSNDKDDESKEDDVEGFCNQGTFYSLY